jgi:AbrB family looped-hinge helix DNA binding protein
VTGLICRYGCKVTDVSNPGTRRRNRRGEGTQLRCEIVAAARELIEETGSASAVTLRAVARRVGIAAPSIYAHFADPEQIIRAVIAQTFEEFLRHLQAAREGIDEPRARLMAACRGYLAFGAEHPNLYALLFARNPTPDGTTGPQTPDLRLHESGEGVDRLIGAESFQLLMDDVAATAAIGASRTEDPFLTATALWVALHGLVLLRADAPQFPWPDTKQLNDVLLGRIALLLRPGKRRMYDKYYVSGGDRVRLNSKGQVTIPAHLREKYGLHEGDEVDVIEDGSTLRIVRVEGSPTRGQRLVRRMRGRATTSLSTDQLLELLRDE